MKMKHLIFAYGTLKKGFGNHSLLAGATDLGSTQTQSRRYRMISLGGFPAVYKTGKCAIEGELYEVENSTLERLDVLESNELFYRRELVPLANGLEAWMYICLYKIETELPQDRVLNTRNQTQVWLQRPNF